MSSKKKILSTFVLLLILVSVRAQVKIGNNHESINPGSLLELESENQGLLFTRVFLDDDLSKWVLEGDTASGMVVFNTNGNVNPAGLYCWFNQKWNSLSSVDFPEEIDTLHFDNDSRELYDDGDTVTVSSGRVSILSSVVILEQMLANGELLEGDIYYVKGDGLYIRNGNSEATTVYSAFIYSSGMCNAGYILYATYTAMPEEYDPLDFILAVEDSFYHEPSKASVFDVPLSSDVGSNGYYAFAVPNDWNSPRIFLKVKSSADDGFFRLDHCWKVSRDMEYGGVLYQVWTLDVPMRQSAMSIIGTNAQFRIE